MVEFHLKFFILVFLRINHLVALNPSSWCPHHLTQMTTQIFEKRTDRFWELDKKSNSWVEVNLPFALLSCVNDNCSKVASIDQTPEKKEECLEGGCFVPEHGENSKSKYSNKAESEEGSDMVLNIRKRISLTRMSETSILVTGESGSIYERFWNGVQWVIAPHDLPLSAGPAVSVFLINQTILALSEAGYLYKLQVSESSQLTWIDFGTIYGPSMETESSFPFQIKTGCVSYDGERAFFAMMNGSLVELSDIESQRWIYHGHPPGGDVVAIADASSIRPDVVFTVSSSGKLYEFDKSSKPSWKKHIHGKGSTKETPLAPSKGCILFDLVGVHSISLFLLTKTGYLLERRLHQRKWRWIFHGGPEDYHLASITAVVHDELTDKIFSLFCTTTTGSVFEYQLPKPSGGAQATQVKEAWVNHMHPLQAKASRGIPGLQIQIGRILFSLDDGRLAELHLSGIGGEGSPPTQINVRKKAAFYYEWSILDAPESEGWNAEYCMQERGPFNCITGTRDEANGMSISTGIKRRKVGQTHRSYLAPSTVHSSPDKSWDQNNLRNGINNNFRMRVMQEGRSYFLITDNGSTFEYIYTENIWLCLRHEHSTVMKGLLGNYNGSLFLADTHGNVLIRERNEENELTWINGTALRKGRQVVGGPPWDKMPGKAWKVTAEDALFFVSKTGRLIQFTVALRKFKWKDCRKPPNTKVAYIVDQEMFRANIVFTVGRNGRLYQYNKVTEIWHEHLQSPHLILSRFPGTSMRQSPLSLTGSIFMVAEDGGLVEYQWNTMDGWNWVEHGTPYKSVSFVGAPGPCVEYNQLFLIGSDGEVYLRYTDQRIWKWKSYGFPSVEIMVVPDQTLTGVQGENQMDCAGEDALDNIERNAQYVNDHNRYCDTKVASVRPILFSQDSLIFELRDGRLAELTRTEDIQWAWSRIIDTPTSLCLANHWTELVL